MSDTLNLNFTSAERDLLRSLADELARLAARPIEEEKRKLWYEHNALVKTRPLIFCDPENGWNEIIKVDDLLCESELSRLWEKCLRKEIFRGSQMQDDRMVPSYFDLSYVYSEGDWGVDVVMHKSEAKGSFVWDSPLKSYDDVDKLHFSEISVGYAATDWMVELADGIFGDLLPVKLRGIWWWTLGMTQQFIMFRGLEELMMDMVDQPDGVHRLMAFIRDGHLAKLDFLEKNGLLTLNNDNTYVGSGGFGWTNELPQPDFTGTARSCDMWGFCESQETVGISPGMYEEFIFPYEQPIMQRFGLNCYGCCEPLDKRWHIVKNHPNLRRVSVSPWCDLELMAENLRADYIYSMKPSPTDLAMPDFDEERIRANLRRAMAITKDCRVEVIMKDCHTLSGDPSRAIRWTKIAHEEADRVHA